MLLSNMLSLETLESQISVVMETVAEAAVTELRRLLDLSSANLKNTAERKRSSPATLPETLGGVKSEEQESQVTPQEDRQQLHKTITTQFTSLMAAWTKEAVEKILMLLKVSLCEADNGLNDKDKQSTEPKAASAGRVTSSKKHLRRSCSNRKRSLKPTPPESDHKYHRGAQHPGVSKEAADSHSVIEPATT
ncbi:zinc finger protein 771-like [Xyrichtys novacula]|uniref:Zinc finger protein 771-like n=1 Tax=Xyrichtys novacula TaxID=13765 RepID=A0AAV1GCG1_XYRNO|nr:zinc finger protein 771-like [Xyrichtys novacula]